MFKLLSTINAGEKKKHKWRFTNGEAIITLIQDGQPNVRNDLIITISVLTETYFEIHSLIQKRSWKLHYLLSYY